jgi:competence protein ComEC
MKRKLAFAFVCYLIGGGLCLVWKGALWILIFQMVVAVGLLFVFLPRKGVYLLAALVFFCMGVTGFSLYRLHAEVVQNRAGRWVTVKGRVEPVIRDDCFLLDVESLVVDGEDLGYRGKLMVYPGVDVGGITVGAEVTAEGQLKIPSDQGYKNYCRGLGAEALLHSTSYHMEFGSVKPFSVKHYSHRAAEWVKSKLEADTVPPQHGEIMKGLLLGGREVGTDTRERFSAAGISHLLAVSGLHVGIVSAVIILILKRAGITGRWRFIILCCVLTFFAFMVGLTPSVVRAVIMMGVVTLAAAVDRKPDMLTSLIFTAFLLIVSQPYIVYSISFQLSFLACLGIALYYPAISKILGFAGRYLSAAVSVTISSQILILPLLIHYFGGFAPASVLANVLAVPLAGMVLWFTVIYLVLYPLHIPLYYTIVFINGIIIEMINIIINAVGIIPFGNVRVEDAGTSFYITYYLSAAAVLLIFNNNPFERREVV